jgi:hypothetical protein
MQSPAFHDAPNTPVTECFICSEGAFLHGAFKLALEAFNEPVNFEVDSCVDHRVEMATSVFQSESVGVAQVLCDLHA